MPTEAPPVAKTTTTPDYHVGQSQTMGMPLPEDVVAALNKTAGIKDAPTPARAAPTVETTVPPEPAKATTEPAKVTDDSQAPKALRDAYEKTKLRLKEIEEGVLPANQKQQQALESKVKDYETKLSAYQGIEEKFKQVDQEREIYGERLRVIDYTQHPEFHDKFVKPVAAAMENANLMIGEMMVQTSDGGERQGNEQDFEVVLRSPNLTEAMRRAKALFGDDLAGTVIGMRGQVLSAERSRRQAFETAAIKSKEAMERDLSNQAETQTRLKSKYDNHSKKAVETDGDLAQPDPTDKEAWDAYEQGAAMADEVVRGSNRSEDDRISTLATVRHRASQYPVMKLKLSRLQTENKEMAERLKAFERSEPGNGAAKTVARSGENQVGQGDIEKDLRTALEAVANRRGR